MFSNRQEKLIRSLQRKKNRSLEGLFVIEGKKLLEEALDSSVEIVQIFCTEDNAKFHDPKKHEIEILSDLQMKKISSLSTTPGLLAVIKTPKASFATTNFCLFLDDISDPGNLGTIIRTAEGFGINQIVLSPDTVELFSPKVVQSSMGSVFRMNYMEASWEELIEKYAIDCNYYAANMGGEELYTANLQLPAVLILGSESHGLSEKVRNSKVHELSIPINERLESYNVAISNAIILSEFKRRSLL